MQFRAQRRSSPRAACGTRQARSWGEHFRQRFDNFCFLCTYIYADLRGGTNGTKGNCQHGIQPEEAEEL